MRRRAGALYKIGGKGMSQRSSSRFVNRLRAVNRSEFEAAKLRLVKILPLHGRILEQPMRVHRWQPRGPR